MLSFASLIPILVFGLFALVPTLSDTSVDDEDDVMDPEDPIDPEDPVDPEDPEDPETPAPTFLFDENGVTINFDENETGRLAVITYVDTEDNEDDFIEIHEARYYLVPDDVVWPDNTSETASNIPGAAVGEAILLSEFEESSGLTLLGTVDLLAEGNDTPTNTNMADALPDLTANTDADYYYLEATTDGDELITFLKEGFVETRNGASETVVTASVTGTDEVEWFTTQTEGVTIDAAGGDDVLDVNAANVTVLGGLGEDTITATVGGSSIEGGAGDDDIRATNTDASGGEGNDRIDVFGEGDNTVSGDAGDDILTTAAEVGTSVLIGGAGNDNLQAGLAGSAPIDATLFGGEGEDFLAIGNGATGSGGADNDLLQIDAGGTGFGDAGDDTIRMSDFFDAEGGTIFATGGAGADTFEIGPRNVFGEPVSPIFAQIEDFDTEEDVLSVTPFSGQETVVGLNIVEDPEGAFTDVNVDIRNVLEEVVTVTVRLIDVTDFSAGDVQLG